MTANCQVARFVPKGFGTMKFCGSLFRENTEICHRIISPAIFSKDISYGESFVENILCNTFVCLNINELRSQHNSISFVISQTFFWDKLACLQ